MKIEINKELFQWEKNRYITFSSENAPIFFVFYNQKSKYGIEVSPKGNKVYFPNSLLKESLPITVEGCVGKLGEGQVLTRKTFKVLKRARPENYIDDEDISYIIYDGGEEV